MSVTWWPHHQVGLPGVALLFALCAAGYLAVALPLASWVGQRLSGRVAVAPSTSTATDTDGE